MFSILIRTGNGALHILEYYKPPSNSGTLFHHQGTVFAKNKRGKTVVLYEKQHIVAAILAHVAQHRLMDSATNVITLDPLLSDVLFRRPPYPTTVTKKQLSKACLYVLVCVVVVVVVVPVSC